MKTLTAIILLLCGLSAFSQSYTPNKEEINQTIDGGDTVFLIKNLYLVKPGQKIKTLTEFRYENQTREIRYQGRKIIVKGPRLWHQEQRGDSIITVTGYLLADTANQVDATPVNPTEETIGLLIPVLMVFGAAALFIYTMWSDRREAEKKPQK